MDDDVVAVCSECRTVITDAQAYNNTFLKEGKPAACKLCGGVMVVVYQSRLEKDLDRMDENRGVQSQDKRL